MYVVLYILTYIASRSELEWDSKPSRLVLVEMKLPKYHTFVIIMVSKSVSPRGDDFFVCVSALSTGP